MTEVLPICERTNISETAWLPLHGDEQCGRGEARERLDWLHARSFQPSKDSEFRLEPFGRKRLAYFSKRTGRAVATEFFVPALLPDGVLVCVVDVKSRGRRVVGGQEEITGFVVWYEEMEERLVPRLRGAGVKVFDEGRAFDLVAELPRT